MRSTDIEIKDGIVYVIEKRVVHTTDIASFTNSLADQTISTGILPAGTIGLLENDDMSSVLIMVEPRINYVGYIYNRQEIHNLPIPMPYQYFRISYRKSGDIYTSEIRALMGAEDITLNPDAPLGACWLANTGGGTLPRICGGASIDRYSIALPGAVTVNARINKIISEINSSVYNEDWGDNARRRATLLRAAARPDLATSEHNELSMWMNPEGSLSVLKSLNGLYESLGEKRSIEKVLSIYQQSMHDGTIPWTVGKDVLTTQ